MQTIKQNLALVVGLGIPALIVLLVAGVIYAPRFLASVPPPAYDFIYAYGPGISTTGYSGGYSASYYVPNVGTVWPKYRYDVVEGKLAKTENSKPEEITGGKNLPTSDLEPKFFLHKVSSNTNIPLSFDQAATYLLTTDPKSPDNFEIVRGDRYHGGVFPFFYDGGMDYNARYIEKKYYSEKLELNIPKDFYADLFVAWVITAPNE